MNLPLRKYAVAAVVEMAGQDAKLILLDIGADCRGVARYRALRKCERDANCKYYRIGRATLVE